MSGRGLVGDLIDNLHAQHGVIESLRALSQDKREIIVRNDVDALKGITAQ